VPHKKAAKSKKSASPEAELCQFFKIRAENKRQSQEWAVIFLRFIGKT
jgi:hypothetical protein